MKRFTFLGAMLLLAIGTRPVWGADFAVLDSDINTKGYSRMVNGDTTLANCSGYNIGVDSYMRDWTAWEFVAKKEFGAANVAVIKDAGINPRNLLNYKVLILANNFALDDYQAKVISDWVRKGNKLVATFGTGYAGVAGDLVSGGTNGLHDLWGDPSTKLNSSYFAGDPYLLVQITRNTGPTQGFAVDSVVNYGAYANLMGKRPLSNRDTNAFFRFKPRDQNPWDPNDLGTLTKYPAILSNRHSKGQVVYFAFSPEYYVAQAYDTAGHCKDDTRYGIYWNPAKIGGADFDSNGGDPAPGLQYSCTSEGEYQGAPIFTGSPWNCDNSHWYDENSTFVKDLYKLMKDTLSFLKNLP